MRNYLYRSMDPQFPGSIEDQKRQFPDAVWFPSPANVKQETGKFQGAGGRLVGMTSDGDQIQEHEGVLVTIAMSDKTWDEKAFRVDMDRVRRARWLKFNRPKRERVDISSRITGDRDEAEG